MLNKLKQLLDGKKTYIIVVLAVVLNVAQQQGWVTVDQIDQINIVLGFLGLGAARLAINKV